MGRAICRDTFEEHAEEQGLLEFNGAGIGSLWVLDQVSSHRNSIARLQEQQRKILYQHPLLRQPTFLSDQSNQKKNPMPSQAQAEAPKEEATPAMEATISVASCVSLEQSLSLQAVASPSEEAAKPAEASVSP